MAQHVWPLIWRRYCKKAAVQNPSRSGWGAIPDSLVFVCLICPELKATAVSDHMEDVLALYEKPLSEAEPVVCLDEKPVVLHADVRPLRPMRPGHVVRRDCEYERRGTANTFCGVEPKAGRHYTRVTPDRSSPRFADYLREIAEHYPTAATIHLVMDNLSSRSKT